MSYSFTHTIIKILDNSGNEILPQNSFSGANVISGSLPIIFTSNGSNLINYEIYGNTNGVGDYDSTTQKYLIPITITGPSTSQTITLSLDAALTASQKITLTDTNVNIPTYNGRNVITIGTTTQPSAVLIEGDFTFISMGPEITYTITYYNYDGSEVLDTETVTTTWGVPVNASGYTGTTPTKASDSTYDYTFAGWSSTINANAAEADVLNNLTGDKNVYAAFSQTEVVKYSVAFYNGSNLLYTDTNVLEGGTAVYSGETPTKTATAQYTYTFAGWNTSSSANAADENALTNVTANRTVYAIFTQQTRTYTVTFYNGNTLLETVQNVPYGATATYSGTEPTKEHSKFTGWSPTNTNITTDRQCYAQFITLSETITDSWDEIIANIDNGTYNSKYFVGQTKIIDVGTEGEVAMQIVAIDTDVLAADNSKTVPITWVSKQLLPTGKKMAETANNVADWRESELRTYLRTTVFGLLPQIVQESILEVTKTSCLYYYSNNSYISNMTSAETIWIPSARELGDNSTFAESSGVTYTILNTSSYSNNTSKAVFGNSSNEIWWTRSAKIGNGYGSYAYTFRTVDTVGQLDNYMSGHVGNVFTYKFPLCFCLGGTQYTINYYSQDGQTLLYSEKVASGNNGTFSGTPTKESTAQYNYTFAGWNTSTGQTTATANVLDNITTDIDVYAAFSESERTYTVYFYNGETLLETVTDVPYGGTATYTGPTPTSSQARYKFEWWAPSNTNITADTSCYAQFLEDDMYESITDTWSEIIANIGNGTYSTKYQVGDTKKIDLGTEGEVIMTIVGIDADDLADNSSKAPITWISKQLLNTNYRMNLSYSSGTEGTGSLGGWEKTEMRSYLKETVKPLIPETVRNAIKPVKKYTRIYNVSGSSVSNVLTTEDVWIPSYQEIFGNYSSESSGVYYSSAFPDNTSRIKSKAGSSAAWWWLRSANTNNTFLIVYTDGSYSSGYADYTGGVALGFCT